MELEIAALQMEKADVILETKNVELKKALDPITNPKT